MHDTEENVTKQKCSSSWEHILFTKRRKCDAFIISCITILKDKWQTLFNIHTHISPEQLPGEVGGVVVGPEGGPELSVEHRLETPLHCRDLTLPLVQNLEIIIIIITIIIMIIIAILT